MSVMRPSTSRDVRQGLGNASFGMSSSLRDPPSRPQCAPRPSTALDQRKKNPVDKTVCAPRALPEFIKTKSVRPRSQVFDHGEQPRRQVTKGASLHTDPFDGSRQVLEPKYLCRVYGALPHQQPHAQGLKQLPTPRKEERGFLSSSGCISFGGKRHNAVPDGGPAPRSPMRRRVSPVRESFDPIVHPECQEHPHGVARPKSPVRPTLEGILKPDPKPAARGYVYRPPWHQATPRTSETKPSNGVSENSPWNKRCARIISEQRFERARTRQQQSENRSFQQKHTTRAPFHTDTPRQPHTATSAVHKTRAPYCPE